MCFLLVLDTSSVFMSTNLNSLKLTLWWGKKQNADSEFNTLSTCWHLHNAVDLHSLLHASAKDALHFLSRLCSAASTMSNISMFQNEPQENDIGVLCTLKHNQFNHFHIYIYSHTLFLRGICATYWICWVFIMTNQSNKFSLCMMWWLLTAGEAINQLGSPNPQFLLSQHFLPAQIC